MKLPIKVACKVVFKDFTKFTLLPWKVATMTSQQKTQKCGKELETMKKFLLAVLAVVAFVVGAMGSQQIKVPDSLPIGTGFPPAGTTFNLRIGSFDEWEILTDNYIHAMVPYTRDMGDLETAARRELSKLAERFVPLPGTENDSYGIGVNIDQFVPEMNDSRPIGADYEGSYFKLVPKGGRFVVPKEALDAVKIGYRDLGVYVGGLSEVELMVNRYSNIPEVSPNGITDVTCSQYPGGVAYDGPDMLQVPMAFAYATLYEDHRDYTLPKGYYILRFGPDKSIWAKYDLETGRKLDSNEPPLEPTALAISLVQLDETGKIALLSRKSLQWGLKLSVKGPKGKSAVLEYADKLGGSWKQLSTLPLTSGSDEVVEPLSTGPTRFYRVR